VTELIKVFPFKKIIEEMKPGVGVVPH
jgi:hypothetical protein